MSNIEYWHQNILFLPGVFLWSKILPLDSKIKKETEGKKSTMLLVTDISILGAGSQFRKLLGWHQAVETRKSMSL
jgi:hypothetical protein